MPESEEQTRFDLGAPRDFCTTHWSVVLAAGQDDTTLAREALEKLCQTYWYPLYAYVRRRGHREPDAKDLTQGFSEHLLRREAFRVVMPGRGKFRSFLPASLNHFLADEHARQQAQKRGGGKSKFSFDALQAEHHYLLEPLNGETPENVRGGRKVKRGALQKCSTWSVLSLS